MASEDCLLKMAKGFGTRERICSVFRKTKFAKTEPVGIGSRLLEVYDSGLTQLSHGGNHSRRIPCLPAIMSFPTYLLPHAGSAIALPLTESWHQKIALLKSRRLDFNNAQPPNKWKLAFSCTHSTNQGSWL